MTLTPQQQRQVAQFIVQGASDELISRAMLISVKLVRPIRRDLEARLRPR